LRNDPKTIQDLRKLDAKYQKEKGFHFKIYYEKIIYALGNSLIFRFLDSTINQVKTNVFGSFIDYLEVHFGRKDVFQNISITNFVNLVAVDAYLQPKIQSAVIDFVANAELYEKTKALNEEMDQVVHFQEDEIKQSLQRQREQDAKKVQSLQKKLRENIAFSDSNQEKSDKLKSNPNASILSQEETNSINNQLHALTYMEHYYQYVEDVVKDKLSVHVKSAEQNRLFGTILFNHFNPFSKPVEPKILSALENDFKVQLANMEKNYKS
jgi:hypothetical protein